MNKLNRIQKQILIFLIIITSAIYLSTHFTKMRFIPTVSSNSEEIISASLESGFYPESIAVTLHSLKGTDIYYTMNGSMPATDNADAILYQDKIILEATETEQVYTIHAAAFQNGTIVSDILTNTYICGININNRYNMPVLSVSGSPDDFYNYEDGIMIHGKLDEEYIAAHPEWNDFFEKNRIPVFGNFYQRGPDAEKEVHIMLFDKNGNRLLSQNCGFRLYGAVSRMKNQPSFRLYARSEYDTANDFDFTFFEDQYTHENTLQSEYKRIIVRNCGNDNGYGFIRSELATRIAKESGFQDSPSASPVCVYLNGNYYGVHWFINNFDNNYFAETYGEYDGEMYVYEGQIHSLEISDDEEDATYIRLGNEYNNLMQFFGSADLQNEENWQKLNSVIDVDNFIQYIAIQHYLSNDDSLHNNFRIYRYYSPDGSYIPDSVYDGRYRFLLFDLDYSFGLTQKWSYTEPEKLTLTTLRIDGDEPHEEFFSNIMKREDCKQLYIQHSLSLMNYYYSENHVKTHLNDMHQSRVAELQFMIEKTDLLVNNFYAPDVTDMDYIAHQMFLIERFSNLRPEYFKEDLQTAFGQMTPYILHINNPDRARVTIDYASVTEPEFTGTYFEEIPVQISAQPYEGYEFDYWLVNDVRNENITLSLINPDLQTGQLTITCVCKPKSSADLRISGIKSKGGDYIKLTNYSTTDKNLRNYHLTDNSSSRKSTLPAHILPPGETIVIYCKNYSEVDALGKPLTNFNIKAGETISLYHTNGELLDSVTVPDLGDKNGIWQRDVYTGRFNEVILN